MLLDFFRFIVQCRTQQVIFLRLFWVEEDMFTQTNTVA